MNKQRLSACLILFSMMFTIHMPVIAADSAPELIHGELDLRQTTLGTNGPVQLEGEWRFYWKEFLEPGDQPNTTRYFVDVPDVWSDYSRNGGTAFPKNGYATYHVTIMLNEQDVGQKLAFYMPSIASAYRFLVNGEWLATVGETGTSRNEMMAGNRPQVVIFEAAQPKLELFLQVSNFHQRKAGIWEQITFGTNEQISEMHERSILLQMFVVGCIFIIGFYHFVLFLQRPQERSPLFLAIACFCIVLRTLLLKDVLILYIFPDIDWGMATRLEYISAQVALISFLQYVKQEFSYQRANGLLKWMIGSYVLYIFFVCMTPPHIFTNTFFIYQYLILATMVYIVFVSFMGVLRKDAGAYLSFFAMLVLLAAVMNDIFYYSSWISTNEFVSIGLLFYLFTQAVQLAGKTSRSFEKVERLSGELQEWNVSLEKKVDERTEKLQLANHRLEKMEQSRRRLLASVSHELNTPLFMIQGYIKAMLDGVVSRDDSTYLRNVYSDTQMMAHLIKDLQELSKLESGQVDFQFENIDIPRLISQIIAEQKPMIEKNGQQLRVENKASRFGGESIVSSADPMRLTQVFLNLLINAQKFTPAGSTIKVELDILSSQDGKSIKVSVSDTGPGISDNDLPYVFDRFYKAREANRDAVQGAGLGLAIVKEMIEHHHGSVGVSSEKGQGSTFFFSLPVLPLAERERS